MNTLVDVVALALSLSTLTASASATNYVVDSSGGGQFTDIPPAIVAAQPGDVLLVMQGVYSGFTLDKGLAIIGYGTVTIAGDASVANIPMGQTAALVQLAPNELLVSGCAGPVLVQDFAALQHIGVLQSRDMRFYHVACAAPDGQPLDGADVTGSRVEFVRCTVNGSNGIDCMPGEGGGTGLRLAGASRVQLARSSIYGGGGSSCFDEPYPPFYGGDGGPGIWLGAGEIVYLTGGGSSQVFGGGGGPNFFYQDTCQFDGSPAAGILNGGTLWYSGATIYGPPSEFGIH